MPWQKKVTSEIIRSSERETRRAFLRNYRFCRHGCIAGHLQQSAGIDRYADFHDFHLEFNDDLWCTDYEEKISDIERPYKVWGGKFTIYLTSLMYVVLMVNEFIDAPKAAITGVGITVAGLIVYLYFKKKNGGEEYKGEGIE